MMRHDLRTLALLIVAGAAAGFGSDAMAGPATNEGAAAIVAAIKAKLQGAEGQVMPNGGAMMPACASALGVSWLASGSSTFRTAAVSCTSPVWTIYAGVRITQRQEALVATKAIATGQLIDATDTAMREVPTATVHGAALTADMLGSAPRAARPVAAGQPITREMTDRTIAVQEGEPATLQVNLSGLKVSAPGLVLQAGAMGDTVMVENATTHHRLKATIVPQAPDRSGTFLIVPAR